MSDLSLGLVCLFHGLAVVFLDWKGFRMTPVLNLGNFFAARRTDVLSTVQISIMQFP